MSPFLERTTEYYDSLWIAFPQFIKFPLLNELKWSYSFVDLTAQWF